MSKDVFPNDSVSKSLRILLLLGCRESVGVSELSKELGVAVSTSHRLLNIMVSNGFVEQDRESRRYRLGPAALQLGRHPHDGRDLLSVSHPLLTRLSVELNETIDLIVLDGPEAFFVDGIESRQSPRVTTRTGLRLPAYLTSGGKALLAHVPYPTLRSRYPAQFRRLTRLTLPDVSSLENELHRIRNRGFALDRGEYHAEVRSIGVAINDFEGKPIAAVAVVGPSARWGIRKLKTLAPILTETAAEITRGLGEPLLRRTTDIHQYRPGRSLR